MCCSLPYNVCTYSGPPFALVTCFAYLVRGGRYGLIKHGALRTYRSHFGSRSTCLVAVINQIIAHAAITIPLFRFVFHYDFLPFCCLRYMLSLWWRREHSCCLDINMGSISLISLWCYCARRLSIFPSINCKHLDFSLRFWYSNMFSSF